MKYKVFDINKPLLSDQAEVSIDAKSPIEAVRKLYPGYRIKPYPSGNIVVSYPTRGGIYRKVYGLFK